MRFPLLLTAAAFQRQRIRRLRGRLPVIPVRSRLLETAFRSLATTAHLQATITRSKFPACFFDAPPDLLPASRPCTPQPLAVCTRGKHASSHKTRSQTQTRHFRPLPGSPLPFGTFQSLRIDAFNPVRYRKAHLPDTPDCLSLPATAALLKSRLQINVPGSLRFRRPAVPQTSWNRLQSCTLRLEPSMKICA